MPHPPEDVSSLLARASALSIHRLTRQKEGRCAEEDVDGFSGLARIPRPRRRSAGALYKSWRRSLASRSIETGDSLSSALAWAQRWQVGQSTTRSSTRLSRIPAANG